MQIYKLSPCRAVACYGKYSNPLFSGSSLNRRYDKEKRKTEQEKATKQAIQEVPEELRKIIFDYPQNEIFVTGGAFQQKAEQKGIDTIQSSSGIQTRSGAPTRPKLHVLSSRSKNKIKEKIEAMYHSTPKAKFTFLTLSFIAPISDKDGQKCLNKFLTVARKNFGAFKYIWVAERQTSNPDTPANIHFHLITDKYFPVKAFNALWVLQQYNAGLSAAGLTLHDVTTHILNGDLQKKLNPFDVKPIYGINGLCAYLTKYVTKNNESFKCSVWHCSRSVSVLFTSQVISESDFNDTQNPELNFAVDKNTGEVYESKAFVTEHAIIVTIYNKEHFSKKLTDMHKLNTWISQNLFTDKELKQLPYIDYHTYKDIYLEKKKSEKNFYSKFKKDYTAITNKHWVPISTNVKF